MLAKHVQSLRRRDPGYAAGVTVTPHVIRRTRAMHLLEAGVNLIYIRDLLGHADVSTTEIYARANAEANEKPSRAPTSRSPRAPTQLDSRPGPPRMARPRLR